MKAETRYMYMNEATKAEARYINMQCEVIAETRYESRKRSKINMLVFAESVKSRSVKLGRSQQQLRRP